MPEPPPIAPADAPTVSAASPPPAAGWRQRMVCLGCGYDLVGLAEPAACPECGSRTRGFPGDLTRGRGSLAALILAIAGIVLQPLSLLCVPVGLGCSIAGLAVAWSALERIPKAPVCRGLRTRALVALILSMLIVVPYTVIVLFVVGGLVIDAASP